MKNLDVIKNMDELRLNLFNSLQADDVKAQEEAFMNFADGLQNAIMEQAKAEISNQNTAYVDTYQQRHAKTSYIRRKEVFQCCY